MAWNNRAPIKPRKRQPPSSKAELREMAEKAVAGWSKPIVRTPAQNNSCPNCGYTETITAHWTRCPRCDARK
jgi:Zn finger protein HypA/HybF involved in hydrogenase expression